VRFDAIVFDSGGTLFENPPERRVDDEPTQAESWAGRFERVRMAAAGLGLRLAGADIAGIVAECERRLPAMFGSAYTHEKLMLAVLERLGLPAKREWACCLADAYAGPRYRSWLFEGVVEMLEGLVQAGFDLHLAVNTAWCGFSMERALQGVGILKYFRTRTYSGEEGLAKPDVRFFRLVERRAGIAGRRILYVGDSLEKDVVGAKSAGWSAVLRISAGCRTSGGLADFEFSRSEELLQWLTCF